MTTGPHLFRPLTIRELTLKNRVVISPMCTHQAHGGVANDWHLVHYGQFALGGAGLILTEATAVEPSGRIGVGDIGLWADEQIEPLRKVVDFAHEQGAAIGVQLAHAGRKAGSDPLWEGGNPIPGERLAAMGQPWRRVGPSPIAAGPAWPVPEVLDAAEIAGKVELFVDAARRADRAGADTVELHLAHGYLAATFLSPVSNHRTDRYGADREGRMRFAFEIAAAVREAWPAHKPLFARISAVDGAAEGGWDVADSVALSKRLKGLGVDVIDCSSGGLTDGSRGFAVPRGLGFQVPFSEQIRREADVRTQAVGMIVDGPQAEGILSQGKADLVAVGRQALFDPYWAHHAAAALGCDPEFEAWPRLHGSWLAKRAPTMRQLAAGAATTSSGGIA